MQLLDPIFILACAISAIAAASVVLALRPGILIRSPSRFAAIDGLRGFLATFVLIHHSAVWYGFARTGQWATPPSNPYAQLGPASVAMFFMVTGFLFVSKIIDSRRSGLSWSRLFVGRFVRVYPLYGLSVSLLLLCVAMESSWRLHEPAWRVALEVFKWATFGMPEINGVHHTFHYVAGVFWSLKYEILFYACLPLVGLVWGVRAPVACIVLAAVAVVVGWRVLQANLLWSFLPGMAAAIVGRSASFRAIARSSAASGIVIVCLGVATFQYGAIDDLVPFALISLSFLMISGGNSVFGLLAWAPSRLLGQISYGIYLLHGLVLSFVFGVVMAADARSGMTPAAHWAVVLLTTFGLVLICCVTFVTIELPGMRSAGRLHAAILRSARACIGVTPAGAQADIAMTDAESASRSVG